MTIAKLNRRIKILQPNQTQDAAGGLETTYAESVEVWASVKPISNKALFIQGQETDRNSYEVVTRFFALPANFRVEYEGRQCNVVGAAQEVSEANKRYLKFIISENDAGGSINGGGNSNLYTTVFWEEETFTLRFLNGSFDQSKLLYFEVWQDGIKLLENSIGNSYNVIPFEGGRPIGSSKRFRNFDKGTFTIKWWVVNDTINLTPISPIREGSINVSQLSFQESFIMCLTGSIPTPTFLSNVFFPVEFYDIYENNTNLIVNDISEWSNLFYSRPESNLLSLDTVTPLSSNGITFNYLLRFSPLNNEWPNGFKINMLTKRVI